MVFFLGGEVTSSRFNLFASIGGFMHVSNLWNWPVGKGDVVVDHVVFCYFRNCRASVTSSKDISCP
jgi:hypothetical protein